MRKCRNNISWSVPYSKAVAVAKNTFVQTSQAFLNPKSVCSNLMYKVAAGLSKDTADNTYIASRIA